MTNSHDAFGNLQNALKSFGLVITAGIAVLTALAPVLNFIQWPPEYETIAPNITTALSLLCLISIFLWLSRSDTDNKPFLGLVFCAILSLVLVWMYYHNLTASAWRPLTLMFVGMFGIVAVTSSFGFLGAAILQRTESETTESPAAPPPEELSKAVKSQLPENNAKGIFELARYVLTGNWEAILESKPSLGYWALCKTIAEMIATHDLQTKASLLPRALAQSRSMNALSRFVPRQLYREKNLLNFLNTACWSIIYSEKQLIKLRKDLSSSNITSLELFAKTAGLFQIARLSHLFYGVNRLYVEAREYAADMLRAYNRLSDSEKSQTFANPLLAWDEHQEEISSLLEKTTHMLQGEGEKVNPQGEYSHYVKTTLRMTLKGNWPGNWANIMNQSVEFGRKMANEAASFPSDNVKFKSIALDASIHAFLTAAVLAELHLEKKPLDFLQAMGPLVLTAKHNLQQCDQAEKLIKTVHKVFEDLIAVVEKKSSEAAKLLRDSLEAFDSLVE